MPGLIPPPASQLVNTYGLWSRPGLSLSAGEPAKLGGPQHNRVVEQPAAFEILEQCCCADGHASRQRSVVAGDVFVAVPVPARETVVVTRPDLDEADSAFQQASGDQAFTAEVFRFLWSVDRLRVSRSQAVETIHFQDVSRFI